VSGDVLVNDIRDLGISTLVDYNDHSTGLIDFVISLKQCCAGRRLVRQSYPPRYNKSPFGCGGFGQI
jgi:hypothetical protein